MKLLEVKILCYSNNEEIDKNIRNLQVLTKDLVTINIFTLQCKNKSNKNTDKSEDTSNTNKS